LKSARVPCTVIPQTRGGGSLKIDLSGHQPSAAAHSFAEQTGVSS
jgi:hypothetical protein